MASSFTMLSSCNFSCHILAKFSLDQTSKPDITQKCNIRQKT